MSFQLRFWGTRGSIPSPGADTVRYGGNTPCVELRTASGALIVLDAGTGIRPLGESLLARADGVPITAELFLSHPHWDHVQGLPFFAPLFRAGSRLTIWGTASFLDRIQRVMHDQMAPEVFPVPFDQIPAAVTFRTLSDAAQDGAGYRVGVLPVRHPGGAIAYRFTAPDDDRAALVYVSDNELGTAGERTPDEEQAYERLLAFTRDARVLVHDATYTVHEYARHRGWGHSTDRDALQLALDARVRTLILFHHKPGRADDEIDRCVEQCRERVRALGAALEVVAAREGMEVKC